MSAIDEARKESTRRLHQLLLWAARSGASTPPEVTMEIEDIQKKLRKLDEGDQLLELLKLTRNHLKVLLNQRQQLGLQCPPHVHNEIITDRQKINHYTKALGDMGVTIELLSGIDVEEDTTTQAAPSAATRSLPSPEVIQEIVSACVWYLENGYDKEALARLKDLQTRLGGIR